MSYEVIQQMAKKAELSRLCRLLEVSRSKCDAWRARAARPEAVRTTGVRLKEAFEASGGRRFAAALRAQGVRLRMLIRRHAKQARWRCKCCGLARSQGSCSNAASSARAA